MATPKEKRYPFPEDVKKKEKMEKNLGINRATNRVVKSQVVKKVKDNNLADKAVVNKVAASPNKWPR